MGLLPEENCDWLQIACFVYIDNVKSRSIPITLIRTSALLGLGLLIKGLQKRKSMSPRFSISGGFPIGKLGQITLTKPGF